MDKDAADYLAKGLYEFRALALFCLTDEDPLPEYLATPLWQAVHSVQASIEELEKRHNCQADMIDLGRGAGLPEVGPNF
ncbi:hypothetical protein KK137_03110 [Croceibacterium sp. LX-88]|uniref:Uncharacterized protein n=1 Tax=Croceibacterium selenioxidans TaxID=2838833 RepID=A0ABS5W4J3_9SPHN|nr:hypothetical protein [Croceibacterium selenioxidans]MBT2133314.1 hypothetical protein [Croceibacterium selenioxidans]